MRLLEGLRLRVKDIDFPARTITVRDGKWHKDRRTMLPTPLIVPLEEHLVAVRRLHRIDQGEGYGEVWLPDALDRKYPNAGREWAWQYVFSATYRSVDPRSGVHRRHHLDESTVQKAVKTAVRRTDIAKKVSCHTFRHCAASGVMPSRWHFTPAFELEGRHNPALVSGLVRARIDRDDPDVSPRRSG